MKRTYKVEWYSNKDKKQLKRNNTIMIAKPTGDTSVDAKRALGLFISAFGNLKDNTIIKIQEFDENGQIGEDIIPTNDENAIIPIGR